MKTVFDTECVLKGKRSGGILENWYIRHDKRVLACIYDDDHWINGETITTSAIVTHYVDENILETLNTFYRLGKRRLTPSQMSSEQLKAYNKSRDEATGF